MTLLIVDAPNLMMRSLFAAAGTDMSANGVATGAFTLFVNALAKHVREEAADHVVLCWEGRFGAERRRSMHSGYKANRAQTTSAVAGSDVACQGLILEFLRYCGITSVAQHDAEADDMIAAYWHYWPGNDKIVILTSDKDMLQLVGTNPAGSVVEQVRLGSHRVETDRWDAERVVEHYGVAPQHLPALFSLMGDTVDGIEGVPRIGPKRGAKLLAEHDFELDDAIPEGHEHYDRVRLNMRLINLRTVAFYPPALQSFHPPEEGTAEFQNMIDFCDRWSMIKLKNRLLTGVLWLPGQDTPRGRLIGSRPGKTPVRLE